MRADGDTLGGGIGGAQVLHVDVANALRVALVDCAPVGRKENIAAVAAQRSGGLPQAVLVHYQLHRSGEGVFAIPAEFVEEGVRVEGVQGADGDVASVLRGPSEVPLRVRAGVAELPSGGVEAHPLHRARDEVPHVDVRHPVSVVGRESGGGGEEDAGAIAGDETLEALSRALALGADADEDEDGGGGGAARQRRARAVRKGRRGKRGDRFYGFSQ